MSARAGLGWSGVKHLLVLGWSDAVSVLHQFTIRTIDFRLDTTPLLECSYSPVGGVSSSDGVHYGTILQLQVSNSGWGSALGLTAVLTCPILIDLFPPAALCFEFAEVESGADLTFTLRAEEADRAVMDRLRKRREVLLGKAVVALAEVDEEILGNEDFNTLLSFHEQWHIEEFFSDYRRIGDGPRQQWHRNYIAELNSDYIPVRLNMHIEYANQDRRPYSEETVALTSFDRSMTEGVLWIGSAGFRYDIHWVSFGMPSGGDAYAVILDPDDRGERNYRISRSIPPGDADRFHVLLASRMSGDYCLQLSFHANGVQVVESDPLWISLIHPRNAHLPASLSDDASFELRNGRLELGSEVRSA